MKRFACPRCGNEVYFDSAGCLRCGARLGLRPESLQFEDTAGQILCRNAEAAGCNWLVSPDAAAAEGGFCLACRHNHLVPNPGSASNRARWAEIERAKRQLIYALLRWSLPHPTYAQDPEAGLGFDFLADIENLDGSRSRPGTGHSNGLITLSLAEGDDLLRGQQRRLMAEPYRTVIGHLRHEIGHYYCSMLVRDAALAGFRDLFGDERQDYAQALQRHYAVGAPPDWQQSHISAYASAHPWEDFAETWAHWMHVTDGLETAWAYGLGLAAPPVRIVSDPYLSGDVAQMAEAWIALGMALNSMNRGMGQPDLYPFVLSPRVITKLRFIHALIRGAAGLPVI